MPFVSLRLVHFPHSRDARAQFPLPPLFKLGANIVWGFYGEKGLCIKEGLLWGQKWSIEHFKKKNGPQLQDLNYGHGIQSCAECWRCSVSYSGGKCDRLKG